MYKIIRKDIPLVNPEVNVGKHPKDNHHDLSGRTRGVGTYHYNQFI